MDQKKKGQKTGQGGVDWFHSFIRTFIKGILGYYSRITRQRRIASELHSFTFPPRDAALAEVGRKTYMNIIVHHCLLVAFVVVVVVLAVYIQVIQIEGHFHSSGVGNIAVDRIDPFPQ